MAGTTKSQRSKRPRCSSSSSTGVRIGVDIVIGIENGSKDKKVPPARNERKKKQKKKNDKDPDHDGNAHNDDASDVLLLDGVEYKNYNDFVAAKRQRNENYLRGLGFHNKKKNKNKKKELNRVLDKNNNNNSSISINNINTGDGQAESSEQEANATTILPRGKLVSPVSSYYQRYTDNDDDENSGGMSFDGASNNRTSSNCNPFYEVSNLLLRLEREQQYHQSLKPRSLAALTNEGNHVPSAAAKASTVELDADASDEDGNKAMRESRSSARAIISLLEEILAQMAPPTSILSASSSSSSSLHCREGYLDAFHQLNGVPLLLRLLEKNAPNNNDRHDKEDKNKDSDLICDDDDRSNIVLLCLGIFSKVCCLSTPQTNLSPSASEKVSLDLVGHDEDGNEFAGGFLKVLYTLAESFMNEILKTIVDKNHPRETTSAVVNAKAKQRKALETTFHAWSIYANLTYFESVTASMGKKQLLHLADLAYWTVAALDCHVTDQLVRFLPIATSSLELENHLVKAKKLSDTTCDNDNDNDNNDGSGSNLAAIAAITSPEAVNETIHIATEVSRVLEPVLGTIRNLVTDPVAAPLDWEAKSLVSKLLDVLCKGEESTKEGPTKSRIGTNEDVNDWLHFVKQTFQSLPEEPHKEDASPETTVFRWMEESEGTMWELLGVFKVCLRKGILSTSVHDVKRLVDVLIRCLRRFGGSSSRIVVRVLGLVDGLVLPSVTMGGVVYGEEEEERDEDESSPSSSAGVQKQILLREGFLDTLVDLSSRYSLDGDCDGEAVRTEIKSMIERLR
jgi:hypothetical protein